jgi:hypothetical protein
MVTIDAANQKEPKRAIEIASIDSQLITARDTAAAKSENRNAATENAKFAEIYFKILFL